MHSFVTGKPASLQKKRATLVAAAATHSGQRNISQYGNIALLFV